MAVISPQSLRVARRTLFGSCLAAAVPWASAAVMDAAAAEPAPPSAPALRLPEADGFLRLAHSSAVLQAQAAGLAASRDTRPEVRAFARRMVEFRREQIADLLSAARVRTLAVSPVPAFEHKVILENLEPLDGLELSRRYSEVQIQALEQEVQAYALGESSPDEWVRTVARNTRPRLEGLLDEARQAGKAVGP
jgi:predicted outer membrane protein